MTMQLSVALATQGYKVCESVFAPTGSESNVVYSKGIYVFFAATLTLPAVTMKNGIA